MVLAASGCEAFAPEDELLASEEQAMLGKATISDTCGWEPEGTTDYWQFERTAIRRALRYGRTVARTPAFRECVSAALSGQETSFGKLRATKGSEPFVIGPYMPCSEWHSQDGSVLEHDPLWPTPPYDDGSSWPLPLPEDPQAIAEHEAMWAAWRAQRVMDVLATLNPVSVGCADLGPSVAGLVGGVHDVGAGPEHITLNKGWSTGDPIGTAGTLWHEAMHLRNYHHGAAEGSRDAKWCDYPSDGDPMWSARHTIPDIVGICMESVLNKSRDACGPSFDLEDCRYYPDQCKTYTGRYTMSLVRSYHRNFIHELYGLPRCVTYKDPQAPALFPGGLLEEP